MGGGASSSSSADGHFEDAALGGSQVEDTVVQAGQIRHIVLDRHRHNVLLAAVDEHRVGFDLYTVRLTIHILVGTYSSESGDFPSVSFEGHR